MEKARTNRLQFVHCETLFETRELAMSYVNDVDNGDKYGRPSLYAEPMILKYKNITNDDETGEKTPNIILAIGSIGDGITKSSSNKTFFIDFAEHSEQINELFHDVNELSGKTEELQVLVENIINACGLNEDGTYKNSEYSVIKDANSISEAIDLLAKFVESHHLDTKETNTIKLTITCDEDEKDTIEGDVKLAPSITVGNKVFDTILIETENGIYANVDLSYSGNGDTLKLLINGNVVSEYEIPTEVHAVSGIYNTKDETLTINLSDNKSFDVDLRNLAGEWKFKVDSASTTPIYFSVNRVKSDTIDDYGDEVFHSMVSADVRINDDKDNILEVRGKGTTDASLFVKGTSDNIKYNDGTVESALDTIMGRGEGSIIKAVSDEKERAESVENLLSKNLNSVIGDLYSFSSETVSNMQKEEQIRRTDDERINERIDVLKEYAEAVSGEVHTEKYAIRNEIASVSGKIETDLSAVEKKLTLKADVPESRNMRFDIRETDKGTFINGFVKVDENAEGNIIQGGNNINGSALYAKADLKYNAKNNTLVLYKSKGLEDFCELNNSSLDYIEATNTLVFISNNNSKKEIQLNAGSIVDRIYYASETEEIVIVYTNAQGVECETKVPIREMLNEWEPENGNHTVTLVRTENIQGKDKLSGDVNVSTKSDNILKVDNNSLYVSNANIVDNTRRIDELNTKLNDEITRAKNAESALTKNLNDEVTRAKTAESEIITNLNNEIDRAEKAEESLNDAIIAEKTRAERAEAANATAISNEVTRATTEEGNIKSNVGANTKNLNDEITRAKNAESALTKNLSDEIVRAEKAEESLNDAIVAEVTRATNREDVIDLKLNNEITRSTNADNDLTSRLNNEVDRAKNAESAITTNINNEIDRAEKAEETLNDAIVAEVTRAKNAESAITINLNNEITRSTNADNEIKTRISDEITRAQVAEEGLGNSISEVSRKIDLEKERAMTAEDVIKTSLNAEHTRAEKAEIANATAISNEVTRATTEEGNIKSNVSANKTAIETEVARATTKENTLETKVNEHTNQLTSVSKDIETISGNVETITNKLDEGLKNIDSNKVFTNNSGSITLSETVTPNGTTILGYANVSSSDGNIIIGGNSKDGSALYASVDIEYNGSTNVLTLVKSNGGSKEIVLNAGSIINDIFYKDKNLVVEFTTSAGVVTSTTVPVADFFKEMTVDNTDGGVDITIKSDATGKWIFSASANVAESTKQALKKTDNTLFVSNQASDYFLTDGRNVEQAINSISGNYTDISSKLQAEIDRAKTAENNLQKDINTVSGKTIEINNSLTALTTQVNTNTADITSLKTRMSTAETNITNNTTDISNLKTQVATNTTNIQSLSSKTENIDARVTTNTNEISNLKSQVNTNTSDISNLKVQVSTNTSEVTNLKTQVATNTTEITNLKSRVLKNEGDISNLTTNVSTISAQVTTNTTEITNLKNRVSKNEGDINNLTTNLNEISNQVSINKTDIENLKTQVNTNTTSIDNIDKRVTVNEGNIANNTTEINNLKNNITSALTQLSNVSSITVTQGEDLTELKQKVNANTTNIANITPKVTKIEGDIVSINTKLDNVYTKDECNSRFVFVSGDTMTGKLNISNGGLTVTGATELNGNVTVTGTVTANGAMYSSDATLKENIKAIDCDKLNAVSNVELKSYNFISDSNKVQKYGIIAQELESVGLNELVSNGENGKKSVDYISFLILKIAQLQSEIDELKKNK